MTDSQPRIFRTPPHFAPTWLRAIAASAKAPKGALSLPRLDMELLPQPVDTARLATYRHLCGFAEGPNLPPTWPQVACGALHLQMLTDPAFPLPAMGVVHLRNHIEQLQPIASDAPLHYACHLEPVRVTDKGDEIELVTDASCNGEVVWRSVITMLSRARKVQRGTPASKLSSAEPTGPVEPLRSLELRVPEDLGRRYARVAGDFNPIHQHALLARPFGFKRAIIHGMWSLARAVAACEADMPSGPVAIDVAFRRPVFLPSTVQLNIARNEGGLEFVIVSQDGATLHLRGTIRPLITTTA